MLSRFVIDMYNVKRNKTKELILKLQTNAVLFSSSFFLQKKKINNLRYQCGLILRNFRRKSRQYYKTHNNTYYKLHTDKNVQNLYFIHALLTGII